jgi:hypothetical protein
MTYLNSIKSALHATLLLFGTLASAAEWKLERRIDAITDEEVKQAVLKSAAGDSVSIVRRSDDSVWLYLKLRQFETFSTEQVLIGRVDKNPPMEWGQKDNDFYRGIGMKLTMWEWNPNLVGGRAWHGKADEGCGFIEELARGSRLVLRYHPNKSTVADVVFSLPKSPTPMLEAIDLKMADCVERPPSGAPASTQK